MAAANDEVLALPAESALMAPLIGLYVVSFLAGFSMGIFNPLISILMEQQGIDQLWIGANSSLYYLMIAAVAPLAGKLINSIGINRVIILGIVIAAASASVLAGVHKVDALFYIRAAMGLGVCLYTVAGQTGLNTYANHKRRGVIVAIHGASFGAGFMISPLVGTLLYAHYGTGAFLFGSGIILLGVLAVLVFLPASTVQYQSSASFSFVRRLSTPLSGAFIYGALEGILVTLLPIVLLREKMPLQLLGLPLTLFMVASGIGMIPVSFFGDRFGRARVLWVSSLVGLVTLIALMNLQHPGVITVSAVLLGLSLGTFFPVTLAMIGEMLSTSEMHAGSGLFTAAFSYGCVVGPLGGALLMASFGNSYIFAPIVLFLVVLILKLAPSQLLALRRRGSPLN